MDEWTPIAFELMNAGSNMLGKLSRMGYGSDDRYLGITVSIAALQYA